MGQPDWPESPRRLAIRSARNQCECPPGIAPGPRPCRRSTPDSGNPARGVVLPKRERYHPKVYADADIRKMLTAAHGTDLYFPLMLALFTGMRRGELIALRWQDVDFSEKKLYVRHSIVSVQGVPEMKALKLNRGSGRLPSVTGYLSYWINKRKVFPEASMWSARRMASPLHRTLSPVSSGAF